MSTSADALNANRLWAEYARTRDPKTREALVRQFERLAFSLANRYARAGQDQEDLVQVALMGLVKAIDRFDPATRYHFSTFATPTILGELKRHFRDHSWHLHVPRGLQELSQQLHRTIPALAARLGREPGVAEIAAELGRDEEAVREAMELAEMGRPLSLDGEFASADADRSQVLESALGQDDRALDDAERSVSLSQALRHLGETSRRIIRMRYLEELSQREVARRLGVSQMRVCRLERRALQELRSLFGVS